MVVSSRDQTQAVHLTGARQICDLRDFTRISDNWPRGDVIDLLNSYFDAMSEPIARHGGEILKFIGDGLLAIFPVSQPSACANLQRVGEYPVRGFNDPIELFAYHG